MEVQCLTGMSLIEYAVLINVHLLMMYETFVQLHFFGCSQMRPLISPGKYSLVHQKQGDAEVSVFF